MASCCDLAAFVLKQREKRNETISRANPRMAGVHAENFQALTRFH